MPNSTQKNLTQEPDRLHLTEKVLQLEKRIEELEKQVRDLNAYVFETSEQKFGIFADFESDPVEPEAPPKRLGRPPKVIPKELARRRDHLVDFIEIRWPDLVTGMKRGAMQRQLLETIKRACPGAKESEGYIKMTVHVDALEKFLKSGRYTGEPRQIAYALAGRPEISWRRSFDYCTKNPSQRHIRPEAFLDHIRRHNPNCHRALLTNGVTEENKKLLSRCCAECMRLASRPQWIARVLRDSQPQIRE